jgi:hypothetical protein
MLPGPMCLPLLCAGCVQLTDYGKQRQWASIGYGLASLPAGWLISSAGLTSAFMVYGLASLPLLLVGSQMTYNYRQSPATSTISSSESLKQQQQQQQISSSRLEQPLLDREASAGAAVASADAGAVLAVEAELPSLRQLLVQPRVLVFLWRCLLMGFAMGVMVNYEFLWLKQLGAPETLMGLAIAVSGPQQSKWNGLLQLLTWTEYSWVTWQCLPSQQQVVQLYCRSLLHAAVIKSWSC